MKKRLVLGAIVAVAALVFLYLYLETRAVMLAIIVLLIFIAWELHRIHERLANGFPTEEEKERRYSRWWQKLPTDQKAWYQEHPDEWAEAERDVRRENGPAVLAPLVESKIV